MMGILTVLWEKWVEFRRDFYKITLAAMIAPLLYILVFGMGIQTMSHGQSYLNFLIPGVVALTTMNGSFNAIAQNLNVQRLYEKAFDQAAVKAAAQAAGMTKPTSDQIEYIELGGADMAEICRPESTGPLAQAWTWLKDGIGAVVEYFR